MDKLDSAITALRIEIDKDQRALAEKQVRLTALVEASNMRPAAEKPSHVRVVDLDAVDAARNRARRTGRIPGSISGEWRTYLAGVVSRGNDPVPRPDFIGAAARHFNQTQATVRQRVRQYLSAGHLIESDDGVAVSEAAIDRFRLGSHLNNRDANEHPQNATAPH